MWFIRNGISDNMSINKTGIETIYLSFHDCFLNEI